MTSEIVESASANIAFFLDQLNPEVRRLLRRLERLHFKKETIYVSQPNLFGYIYIYIYIYN